MQRLSRMRFHLVQNLTGVKQYFLQNLFFKCSAFKQEVDSSVFGNAILELLLEKYTLDEIAEIGDVHCFKDQAALAKYAGLTWPKRQSGNMKAENTKLIRSGNRYLRYYLVKATNSVRRHDAEFNTFLS